MNYIEVRKEIKAVNQKIEYIQEITDIFQKNIKFLVNNPEISNEFIAAVENCINFIGNDGTETVTSFEKYKVFLTEIARIPTVDGRAAVLDIGLEVLNEIKDGVSEYVSKMQAQNRGKTASAEQGILYETIKILKGLKCRRVLDINNCLEKGELICKRFDNPYGYLSFEEIAVDSLVQEDREVSFEAEENLYNAIVREESALEKNYDAVLLLNEENTTANIEKKLEEIKSFGHYIVIKAPDEGDREIRQKYPFKCFQTEHGKLYVLDTRPAKYTGQAALYVVAHKPFKIPEDRELYIPIHAGKNGAEGFGIPGDDTGDNISELNPYINELTAVYWIWKNDREHKYIGINHYRRFFSWKGCFDTTELATEDTVLDLMKECDVVIVDPLSLYPETVAESTRRIFSGDIGYDIAYDKTREALGRVHPEDVKYFDRVMGQYKFAACNIFIMKQEIFNEYCNWLFSFILDALDEWLKAEKPTDANNRAIGFMGERMLAVWLKGRHLKVKPLNGFKFLN